MAAEVGASNCFGVLEGMQLVGRFEPDVAKAQKLDPYKKDWFNLRPQVRKPKPEQKSEQKYDGGVGHGSGGVMDDIMRYDLGYQ